MPTPAPPDVVVVGGGVVGLSVAWRAASCGLAVTVVDPCPGRGATWAAAGMLAPAGEAHFGEQALWALNVEAARAWPAFARDLEAASGRPVGYETAASVLVAVNPSDAVAVDDLLGFHAELGLPARRLTASRCRALEPLLSPAIRGGAELPDDHAVNNRQLVGALLAAMDAAGVTLVEADVAAVSVAGGAGAGGAGGAGGAVEGVVLDDGTRLTAGAVVVAAGCRSGMLGGLPVAVRPPVRPVKGLTLRLRRSQGGPVLSRIVRGLVHGRTCYLVPRHDGTLVVGATVEERGFDLAVQAGSVADLLEDARRLVPAVDEYELVETATGLRPGSPDNAPLVGTTGIGGLLVATGHYRNGILLAPVTADEICRLLGAAPPGVGTGALFDGFRPGRFAAAAAGGAGPAAPPPATEAVG